MPVEIFLASRNPKKLIEMEHILRTLEKNGGNKPTTAKELGISLKTLYNKLNRWGEEKRRWPRCR